MKLSSQEKDTNIFPKKSPVKKETIFGKYKFNIQKYQNENGSHLNEDMPVVDTGSDADIGDSDDEEIISFARSRKKQPLNRFGYNKGTVASSAPYSNKKRKLVRSDQLERTKPKKALKLESDEEYYSEGTDEDQQDVDDDAEDEEYQTIETSKKPKETDILKFMNKANEKDIADIADIHIAQALEIIKNRPFSSVKLFKSMNFPYDAGNGQTKKTNGKRKARVTKTDGEKIFDKAHQTLEGYNAIESLIKKCSKYGDLIANEIKKWGVEVNQKKGAATDGALDDGPGLDFLVVKHQNDVEDQEEEQPKEDEKADVNAAGADVKTDETNDVKQDPSIGTNEQEEAKEDKEEKEEPKGTGRSDQAIEAEEANEADEADEVDEADEADEDFVNMSDENVSDNEDMDDDDYDENFEKTSTSKTEDVTFTNSLDASGPTSTKFFTKPPKYLDTSIQLKDYQLSGINWLYLLYCNDMSCILADEMGLGKTCQVIAFLAYLKQMKAKGPHLIVVPSSTLENWLREFAKFCPALKVQPYYGTQNEREELREILDDSSQYDVLVTTYNLASGNKYDQSFLIKRNFNCVVFDEGHMLKNSLSERFDKLIKIRAHFRLLLTGTPLQNNLKELISLLNFIMPSLFTSQKENLATLFKQKTSTTVDKGYNPLLAQEAIMRAKVMMKPFILRRRKQQVLQHLPPKHIKIVHCDMLDHQKSVYDKQVQEMIKNKFDVEDSEENSKTTKKDVAAKKQSNVNYIMALRKASIHPLLFRDIYNDNIINEMSFNILQEPRYIKDGNQQYIKEDMSYMNDFELDNLCHEFPATLKSFKLKEDEFFQSGKVKKLLSILNDVCVVKNEKILVFSMFTQVLNILERVLKHYKYQYLRLDGQTSVNDRQSLIDEFYANSDIKIFILSTKAGGFGINLVAANNVVIFDQSFNPHDDAQAMDRAHRVGQTKDVSVFTLITKDSIEEQIYKMAQNKLQLDSHISEDQKKESQKPGMKVTAGVSNKIQNLLQDMVGVPPSSSTASQDL